MITPDRLELLRQWSTPGEWTIAAPPGVEEVGELVRGCLRVQRLAEAILRTIAGLQVMQVEPARAAELAETLEHELVRALEGEP